MSATPSIVVKKQMSYRGTNRIWSNRYHFLGGTPATTADWTTFSNNVVNAEALCLTARNQIVETIGYAAGSDVPVFSKSYTTTGGHTAIGTEAQMGEVAALIRWSTDQRTSKNHPIYLFSYVHGVYAASSASPDTLASNDQTAMLTYANAWVTGFSDGALTLNRAGPNGAAGLTPTVETNLTVHSFPR